MIRMDYSTQRKQDILCVDVKAFFASVESVKRGLHPLKSSIVVMSNPDRNGGLVLAASPQVKKDYGIQTGSRRYDIPKNANIHIVEPRMALYIKVNGLINQILKEFVAEEDLHMYSIDESFLDVSKSHALFGSTRDIAKKIQHTLFQRLKLVTAIGTGDNLLLAKLALDHEAKKNPSHLASWHYDDVPDTVWKIHPLTDMWGIGKNTAKRLYQLGIDSVYSLSQYDVNALKRVYGVIGEQLFYHAHGIDQSVISEKYYPKSQGFGKSQILKRDYVNRREIEVVLREIADEVSARLRKHKVETGVVHLSIGFSREVVDKGFSHQLTIHPTASTKTITQTCLQIFRSYYRNQPVRRIGLRCGHIKEKKSLQMNLFEKPEQTIRTEDLESVVDKIRGRYGFTSLVHASSLTRGGTTIERSGLVGGHKG